MDLLTITEVADELRLTRSTLRRWRHENTGPNSAKIGSRVFYRRDDLERWVDQQFDQGVA